MRMGVALAVINTIEIWKGEEYMKIILCQILFYGSTHHCPKTKYVTTKLNNLSAYRITRLTVSCPSLKTLT